MKIGGVIWKLTFAIVLLPILFNVRGCDRSGTQTNPEVKQETTAKSEALEYFSLRPEVEKQYGYAHAVKIGDDIKISDAASMDDKGTLVAPGNLEQQMKNGYGDLEKILKHYGYTFDDVVVENVFTTDMAGFIKVSGYRNTIYKKQFPTGTWLEVKGLALPGRLSRSIWKRTDPNSS